MQQYQMFGESEVVCAKVKRVGCGRAAQDKLFSPLGSREAPAQVRFKPSTTIQHTERQNPTSSTMVEKVNSTKRLTSAEKSKKSSKSTPSIAKSTEKVEESDMESESEDESENGSGEEEEEEEEEGVEEEARYISTDFGRI